jgi:hypothetical protein
MFRDRVAIAAQDCGLAAPIEVMACLASGVI